MKRLEKVLHQLNQHELLAQNGASFQVTFSARVVHLPDDGDDLKTLCH